LLSLLLAGLKEETQLCSPSSLCLLSTLLQKQRL
jgi:hypothetical protein